MPMITICLQWRESVLAEREYLVELLSMNSKDYAAFQRSVDCLLNIEKTKSSPDIALLTALAGAGRKVPKVSVCAYFVVLDTKDDFEQICMRCHILHIPCYCNTELGSCQAYIDLQRCCADESIGYSIVGPVIDMEVLLSELRLTAKKLDKIRGLLSSRLLESAGGWSNQSDGTSSGWGTDGWGKWENEVDVTGWEEPQLAGDWSRGSSPNWVNKTGWSISPDSPGLVNSSDSESNDDSDWA
jgi:hypothetical protein